MRRHRIANSKYTVSLPYERPIPLDKFLDPPGGFYACGSGHLATATINVREVIIQSSAGAWLHRYQSAGPFCYSCWMEDYARVWKSFVSGGHLEFGGHMDPGWQDGHTLSASFIVPVDTSAFEARLEPLRNALKTLPFVSLHPYHFMHITLLPLGFVVPEPDGRNEISPERLTEVETKVRSALMEFPAFEIKLANLNAFPGAAFVEAYDDGMLTQVRKRICEGCGIEAPTGPPHLTLAYFQAPNDTPMPEGLVPSMEQFRDWPVGRVPVDHIELTLLDLRADYPEPDVVARIPLKEA